MQLHLIKLCVKFLQYNITFILYGSLYFLFYKRKSNKIQQNKTYTDSIII